MTAEEFPNTCADCHAHIRRRPHGLGWVDRFGALVCRTKQGRGNDGQPTLSAADYHYVFGEEQRHFPKREGS